MRLVGRVRSLETISVESEGSDRDAAKRLIGVQVPDGYETFIIGYTPLDASVRACAILWSTQMLVFEADGPDYETAYASLMALVPADRRHAVAILQDA